MPFAVQEWFAHHFYVTVLVATIVEGLGLPLPAEALFLATAVLAHRGSASLSSLVLVAASGNAIGSSIGFSLAYLGGPKLLKRVSRLVGIKAAATDRVAEFFKKYGATTVFLSRFIGFIRAATIYSAGAARMAPWRFVAYIFAAAILWNGIWGFVAFRFGHRLPHMSHQGVARLVLFVFVAVAVILMIQLTLRWYRRRNAIDS